MQRYKFINEITGTSLKNIKRLEVKFDPFHPNAPNVREFWAGITDRKQLRTNPELVTKTTIVCDNSDPIVTVRYKDDHKLILNGKYMQSCHFLELIKRFEKFHRNDDTEE